MHIPSSMLSGAVCPVTLAMGTAGVGVAAIIARRSTEKPSAQKFAVVTSLIFALQMLNFPVSNGTSGHLIGGLLAVGLLGAPFAILSISIVLAVQALFFADGGINALGANIFNMAVLGAGLGGVVFNFLKEKGLSKTIALGMAAWSSVVLAAAACSLEVALSGAVALNKVLPAMLSVHAFIGIGESVLTVAVVALLTQSVKIWRISDNVFAGVSFVGAVIAATLSPLASAFPDGLEWVSGQLNFAQFQAFELPALFPGYQVGFIHNAALSTILAGLLGVSIVFIGAMVLASSITKSRTVCA